MLTKEEITGVLRENLAYLASEYGVERIGLFGSYAKDMPTESSDVGIVVEFTRPIGLRFAEFAECLEDLLGKRVDVLTPAGIQEIRTEHIARDIRESIVCV
jgi:predicted nucleotidyltransferase